MYEPLRDISSRLLVPNLGLIPPNTISLMVRTSRSSRRTWSALNHEFARELLWREYPTDQRRSTLPPVLGRLELRRQARASAGTAGRGELRDITRSTSGRRTSKLGEHNNRAIRSGSRGRRHDPEERSVVLVIRGDLLKRYPNTIIYAQRARWGEHARRHSSGSSLWDETGEKAKPTHRTRTCAFRSTRRRSRRTSISSAST